MKRRFRFRLERVARIRGLEERVARAERAAAELRARAADERAQGGRSALERSREWLEQELAGRIEPRSLLLAQRALDLDLRVFERSLESARTLRTQAERLAAAHRSRRSAARALEELRARLAARHRADLERAENAALDEAALEKRERERRELRKRETDSSSAPRRSDEPPRPQP